MTPYAEPLSPAHVEHIGGPLDGRVYRPHRNGGVREYPAVRIVQWCDEEHCYTLAIDRGVMVYRYDGRSS